MAIIYSQMQINLRTALEQKHMCTLHFHSRSCSCSFLSEETGAQIDTTISIRMPQTCSGRNSPIPSLVEGRSAWGACPDCPDGWTLCQHSRRPDSRASDIIVRPERAMRPESTATVPRQEDRLEQQKGKRRPAGSRCTSPMLLSTVCHPSLDARLLDNGINPASADIYDYPPARMNGVPVHHHTRSEDSPYVFPSSSFSHSISSPSATTFTSSSIVSPSEPLVGRQKLQASPEERSPRGNMYYLQSLPLPVYSQGFIGPMVGFGFGRFSSSRKGREGGKGPSRREPDV